MSTPDDDELFTDEELAEALDDLYGPDRRDPLAGYACPVTRRRMPDAIDRPVVDVLPSL